MYLPSHVGVTHPSALSGHTIEHITLTEQHPLVMSCPWQDGGKGQKWVSSYFSENFGLLWGSEHRFVCFFCVCVPSWSD